MTTALISTKSTCGAKTRAGTPCSLRADAKGGNWSNVSDDSIFRDTSCCNSPSCPAAIATASPSFGADHVFTFAVHSTAPYSCPVG